MVVRDPCCFDVLHLFPNPGDREQRPLIDLLGNKETRIRIFESKCSLSMAAVKQRQHQRNYGMDGYTDRYRHRYHSSPATSLLLNIFKREAPGKKQKLRPATKGP
jgi:hypothetical protein